MSVEYCDFYGLSSDSCPHCTGRVGDEAISTSDVVIVATWEARYHGSCNLCKQHITPGDLMGKTENDEYVCNKHLEGF